MTFFPLQTRKGKEFQYCSYFFSIVLLWKHFYFGNISTSFITDSQQHLSVAASILSSSSKLCNCTVEHQHGGDDIYLHAKIRVFSDQIPPICPSNHPQIWFNLLKQLLKLPFYIDNSGPGPLLGMKECFFEKCIYAGKRYGTSFYLLLSDLLAHLVTNFHAGEEVSQEISPVDMF